MSEEKKKNKKWDGWKDCENVFVQSVMIDPMDKRVYKQLTTYLENGQPKTYNPKDFPEYLWRMDSPDFNLCRFLVASMLHDIEQGERTVAECLKAIYRYSYPQEYNSLKRIRLMDASTLFSLTGFKTRRGNSRQFNCRDENVVYEKNMRKYMFFSFKR